MYILKTWDGQKFIAWSSQANPNNINKLIQLHELMYPKVPYIVDIAD